MSADRLIPLALVAVALAACSRSPTQAPAAQSSAGAAAPSAQAVLAKAINDAQFTAPPSATSGAPPQPATPPPDPALIKAEVLLARAHASPGEVDGLAGSNLKRAVSAYEQMNGLPDDGQLSQAVWDRLTAGSAPVAGTYTVTAEDAAGPYSPDVGEDMVAASKLPAVGYARPSEMFAERFHMSETLLQALNPKADFGRAGTVLVVARPDVPPVPAVDHIEVDKAAASARAYGEDGAMIGSFPATVGSTDRPSPSGVHKVLGVSFDPDYVYDPSKLSWGPRRHGKFTIKPGPNNPVGLVWIDLSQPGYGIHGSPDPDKIGKTASHGCVRLTNWDAVALAHAVKPGVTVTFVRARGEAG
jgi:lipoprotein-anchoring transpeptidase ErfK/SrfK